MATSTHRFPAAGGLVVLAMAGLLVGSDARAGEDATGPKATGAWTYDVRIVRVDAPDPAVLEAAPSWQPTGASGATTAAPWADLLAGLKARGRATILMDQRLTASGGGPAEFKQERRRGAVVLRTRMSTAENWEMSYVETGTNGQLLARAEGLEYDVRVRWEEDPGADGTTTVGSTTWKGSYPHVAAGETLVLSYRQQQVGAGAAVQGLEIYVLVTGWPLRAK